MIYMTDIHDTAIIEKGAVIGKNVTIEPFAIVKSNVILEDDVTIKSHAYLDGYTTIGKGTTIYPSAVIGTKTQDKKFKGEKRILCPSPKVATYDLQPEMSAADIRDAIIPELKKGEVDFVCLNFANPDMVGHTGVFEAAVKACETVDQCAGAVVTTALENGYTTLIIADHGNSDMMINPDGSPNTAHTTNLVPLILVDKEMRPNLKSGKLGDLAPTMLTLMGMDIPTEMTGEILV